MSLFSTTDIAPRKKEEAIELRQPMPYRTNSESRFAMGSKGSELEAVLGEIKQDEIVHLPCFANWSSHHLIKHLLTITGPADVYLTSWSIKNTAASMLIDLMKIGTIKHLSCVFDPRIRTQCPEAWQLADYNINSIRLYKCHAKVTVIENEEWAISVVATANLTRNPRIECYVIDSNKGAAQFHKKWIKQLIDHSEPFDHGMDR